MDSKPWLLLIVAVIFCAAFAITFVVDAYVPLKSDKTVKHEAINFDSRSQDKALSSIKELFVVDKGVPVGVKVGFKMKVENITGWNNIFQTAPYNAGVRVELSEPGAIGLVVGDGTDSGLIAFQMAINLEKKVWHTVMIDIDKDNNLVALLDGKEAVREKSTSINYKINEIAVGTGFNKSRPFDGQISDFYIEYSKEYEQDYGFLFMIVRVVAIAGFLLCLAMIFTNRRKTAGAPR